MLIIFTLSFVKLLWPLLRFLSCTHDQDSRTPTIKMLTLIPRVMQKHVFHLPKIKTSFICHESFSPKFSYAKKKYEAMLKKERDTWSSQNSKRKEKNGTHEGSKMLEKRKIKIAHTSKAILKKRESHDQRSTKILGLGKYSTHLHFLIKVYDLHLLGSSFSLSKICDASMPHFQAYLKLH